jgi:hypothetical protein
MSKVKQPSCIPCSHKPVSLLKTVDRPRKYTLRLSQARENVDAMLFTYICSKAAREPENTVLMEEKNIRERMGNPISHWTKEKWADEQD